MDYDLLRRIDYTASHRKYSLSFAGEKLRVLPGEIGRLTDLKQLYLSSNRLTSLPPEIGKLSSLTELYLADNLLTTLPTTIGELVNLTDLDLSNNRLTGLPLELGKLARLKNLKVTGNPLESPPPEILHQGTSAIVAYLRGRLHQTSRQWISKLLVVGEGGVGKTSLLGRLRGERFDISKSTTHGIEVGSLQLSHPGEPEVTMQLNTWDFGGQEIYHATHQFFLTNRSLFLLLWNARLGYEQGRLYYWLDTIKARAPESPVILVATFIDERDARIPIADLRRKYPQVLAHTEVSNLTGTGIDKLMFEIARAAAALPLMGENWPTNWLNASNSIRSRNEKYITPHQLFSIFAEHGVSTDSAQVLARWLHELGDILYFVDDEDLNDIVILDPQWVTHSISKVLESDQVINNIGMFTRHHMNELWSDLDPGTRDHFLRLMEKFDLSYRTLENKEISLVVERLGLDPPEYRPVWDQLKQSGRCHEISMNFELDTRLPAGIPTWFIARSHRFTMRMHWRYGALFSDGSDHKHLGLVQAFPPENQIHLAVRGATPHNFFALLRDGLELTLKRFPGVTIRRRIPCPGHGESACEHEFDLVTLERAIERTPPILEIQCPVAFEDISILTLLLGLHWETRNELLTKQYNELLEEMKQMSEKMEDKRAVIQRELENTTALIQREFTKVFRREQAKLESYCPNSFVLRPSDSSSWTGNVFRQRVRLHLYCQKPGQWHPTETGGIYDIDRPAEWLQVMSPYIKRLFSVLRFAAPLVGPWVGILSPDDYKKRFEDDIKLMEELVKKLPGSQSGKSDDIASIDPSLSDELVDSYTIQAAGAELRALRRLLEEKDPQRQWGGLKRVLTPEGHYLWLCGHHSVEYAR